MPLYTFYNETLDKYTDVFFNMNDKKVFNGEDGSEAGEWRRVFHPPQLAKDSLPIDPYSDKEYIKATDKKGSVGDMLDLSAELSEKRESKDGKDPVKEKYFKKYKETHGIKHFQDRPKVIETKDAIIKF